MSTLTLLLTMVILSGDGLPDHPRLLLNARELTYLESHGSDVAYREAFAIVRQDADAVSGPAVNRHYDWNDVNELYGETTNGPLFLDSRNLFALGLQYQISGERRYVDMAVRVLAADVQFIDVTYRTLNWWDSIKMDIMGVRLLYALDFFFDALHPGDRASFEAWLRTYVDTVRHLHEQDTSGQYYADHDSGNNIKSWDNALIGLTGYLFGDPELIEYALRSSANASKKSQKTITLDYQSQIRRGIVDEWSGRNSRYGPHRTVDWWRSIEKGYAWPESVSYQAYHQQANEVLARAARLHGLDLHHFAARAEANHARHQPLQPIERLQWFLTLDASPEDNQWRHWDGARYVYTDADRTEADRSLLKLAGFADLVGAPSLDRTRERLDEIVKGGLRGGGKNYADFHIVGYAWPLLRLHALGTPPPVGDLDGMVTYAKPASAATVISLLRAGDAFVPEYELPVEVDAGGSYAARALPASAYEAIVRCDGFKSTGVSLAVSPGVTSHAPPLVLAEGTHRITPPSCDYLQRDQLATVDFEYRDPQGYAPLGLTLAVLVRLGPGQFLDLLAAAPGLFEVVRQDGHDLTLRLNLGAIALPRNEITLYFMGLESATGTVLCDRARYRMRQ